MPILKVWKALLDYFALVFFAGDIEIFWLAWRPPGIMRLPDISQTYSALTQDTGWQEDRRTRVELVRRTRQLSSRRSGCCNRCPVEAELERTSPSPFKKWRRDSCPTIAETKAEILMDRRYNNQEEVFIVIHAHQLRLYFYFKKYAFVCAFETTPREVQGLMLAQGFTPGSVWVAICSAGESDQG